MIGTQGTQEWKHLGRSLNLALLMIKLKRLKDIDLNEKESIINHHVLHNPAPVLFRSN